MTTKNYFFKSIKCHTFLEPQARSDLNDDNDDDDNDNDNNNVNDNINEDNTEEEEIIIFFKSIRCHTFSEPQAQTDLNDDDDVNNDNSINNDDNINEDNKEEEEDDEKLSQKHLFEGDLERSDWKLALKIFDGPVADYEPYVLVVFCFLDYRNT